MEYPILPSLIILIKPNINPKKRLDYFVDWKIEVKTWKKITLESNQFLVKKQT